MSFLVFSLWRITVKDMTEYAPHRNKYQSDFELFYLIQNLKEILILKDFICW